MFQNYIRFLLPHRHSFAWRNEQILGNVLVEALESGLPVVCTHCESGPAEILDNGRFGALVPVGDPSSLAAEMAQRLKHRLVDR
ncbi:MAG: glycosyltransferase [Deltaproteobacteria bacterium]|nr:glycosyltransferase [Deltaproteobacteria bacterium]